MVHSVSGEIRRHRWQSCLSRLCCYRVPVSHISRCLSQSMISRRWNNMVYLAFPNQIISFTFCMSIMCTYPYWILFHEEALLKQTLFQHISAKSFFVEGEASHTNTNQKKLKWVYVWCPRGKGMIENTTSSVNVGPQVVNRSNTKPGSQEGVPLTGKIWEICVKSLR